MRRSEEAGPLVILTNVRILSRWRVRLRLWIPDQVRDDREDGMAKTTRAVQWQRRVAQIRMRAQKRE
jgi:hypothetical protein